MTPREYWEVLAVEDALGQARSTAERVRAFGDYGGKTAWHWYIVALGYRLESSQYMLNAVGTPGGSFKAQ